MNRPFVFCHMLTSLDGKITGGYMGTPQGNAAGEVFYDLAFGPKRFYQHQGWRSGRVTTDDNFTFYHKPALDENAPAVPAGDYLAQPDFGMFYVSVDPHGKLGWESATLHYEDTTAHVIEVLTNQDQLSQVNSANVENLCFSREAAQHKEAIPSRINGIAAPSASLTV